MKAEYGPIYGIELIDTLPIDGSGMKQQLPSRQDLDDLRRCKINGNDRIVAGFEVLTEHYRRLQKRVALLEHQADCLACDVGGVHCKECERLAKEATI